MPYTGLGYIVISRKHTPLLVDYLYIHQRFMVELIHPISHAALYAIGNCQKPV